MESPGSLTINNREIENSEPLSLQYFKAVDAMTAGVTPDNSYYKILLYEAASDVPKVQIIRIETHDRDNCVHKQDEVDLKGYGNRLQFNADIDTKGDYVKYPQNLSEFATDRLNQTVETFNRLAKVNGSTIFINNRQVLVSSNGIWMPFEDNGKSTPQFAKPQDRLPGSN
jgi:hypothetical protein